MGCQNSKKASAPEASKAEGEQPTILTSTPEAKENQEVQTAPECTTTTADAKTAEAVGSEEKEKPSGMEMQAETTQAAEMPQEDAKTAPAEEPKIESQGETVPAPGAPTEDAQAVVTEESKTEPQVEPCTELPKEDANTAPPNAELQGEATPSPEMPKEDAKTVAVEESNPECAPATEPPKEEVQFAAGADKTDEAEVKETADDSPKENANVEARSCDIFGMWCKA